MGYFSPASQVAVEPCPDLQPHPGSHVQGTVGSVAQGKQVCRHKILRHVNRGHCRRSGSGGNYRWGKWRDRKTAGPEYGKGDEREEPVERPTE